MNKKITLFAATMMLVSYTSLFAQSQHWCHASEVNNQAMLQNPAAKQAQEQLESFTADYVKQNFASGNKMQGIVYIIPVVFHVLHNWGPENISDAQIYNAIDIMNRDFRKLNADTASIVQAFIGIAADVEIEFRLAHLDQFGNCTNGIDRIVTPLTYAGDDAAKLNPWPSNRYLNIWTCNVFGPAHAGAAAYAYYPGSAPSGKDGIISLYDYVGGIGASNAGNSRTLTHETGHWLNLRHIWGSTNQPNVACGDDLCNDTPWSKGHLPGNCNLTDQACGNGIENVQNYMEYAYCSNMFTEDQKTRMRLALLSSAGGRSNVSTVSNLAFTGTDGGVYVCTPTALFNSTYTRYVCVNQNITFNDASLNTDSVGVTYLWTFNGGTSSTTTQKNATVQYANPGLYDVSLTVTSSSGSDTYTATGIVVVSGTTGAVAAPFAEGFESFTIPANDWYVDNYGGNGWTTTSQASHSGSQCVMVENFSGNTTGTIDELITTSFSLANTSSVKCFFYSAYKNKTTGSSDMLRVYGSTNCAQTWQIRLTRTASQLAHGNANSSANFIPTPNDWDLDSVSLATYSNQPSVRLKFQYTYDDGNNLYLDDINISGLVGLEDNNIEAGEVSIAPNPASKNSRLDFTLLNTEKVLINVTDVLGREVQKIADQELTAGDYQYEVNTQWGKGIYFVRIIAGNQQITKKLVVE